MAGFDPEVPTINPENYMFWSRPIQQPRPDKSGEIAGETIGKGLAESGRLVDAGAEVANKLEQRHIGEDIASAWDPIVNDRIQSLSRIDDVVSGKKPGQESLVPESPNMPQEVKNLPSKVDNLIAIRDNGHISDTEFNMLRDRLATQIRTKYPHQREFIDQEFTRITEREPANKVVSSLTQDINAWAANAKEKMNKDEGRIFNSGIPGLYQNWKGGKVPTEKALGLIADDKAIKARLERDDLVLRNKAMNRTLQKEDASDHNNDALSADMAQFMQGKFFNIPGMDKESLPQFLTEWQQGKHPMSDEQAIGIAQAIDRWDAEWTTQARYMLNKVDSTGKSRADYMGGAEAAEKLIQEKRKQFITLRELFSKEQIPQAVAHKMMVETALQDQEYNLTKNAPASLAIATVNKLYGSQSSAAAEFFTSQIADPNTPQQLKSWVLGTTSGMVSQQPGYSASGGVFTLGEALTTGANKGVTGTDGAKANRAVIKTMADTILNPNTPEPVKVNATNAVYADEDKDLVKAFKNSEVDNNGNIKPGKSTAFSTLVNDKISRSIRKMGNPEISRNYINTSSKWFGNIFHSEIETLNRATANVEGSGIAAAVSRSEKKPYQVMWDSEHNSWHLMYKGVDLVSPGPTIARLEYLSRHGIDSPYSDLGLADRDEIGLLRSSIIKLNAGTQAMAGVFKTFSNKQDMTGFMVQLFMAEGLDPNNSPDSPAGQLLEAMKHSVPKQTLRD